MATAAAVFIVVTSRKANASPAAAPDARTVVLVHGAFADGSSWNKVIPLLQSKRIEVISVQNPLTSLADDVAATKRAIALAKGPVVLVGHSWGRTVITEAGSDAKVVALVYIAAAANDVGGSFNDLGKAYPPPPGFAEVKADASGFASMTAVGIDKHFRAGPEACRDGDDHGHARAGPRGKLRREGDGGGVGDEAVVVRRGEQ